MAKIKKNKTHKKFKKDESSNINTSTLSPVFCLKNIRNPYGIDDCEKDDQAALSKTLCKLCKLTWNQIISSNRHGVGCEKIEYNEIKPELPSGISADNTFISLRFSGMKPMVGFRSGRIFHILFLDHNFTVYNH